MAVFMSRTAPGALMPGSGHYLLQFVVRGGKIEGFREFQIPIVLTPPAELRSTANGVKRGPGEPRIAARYGSSTVEPVVLRPSRSRCACAASASG